MHDPYKSLTDLVKPEDKRFILDTPDEDFSPERNKAIVEQSIKDYEAMRAKKMKDRVEEYAERADAVTTYLKSLTHGRSNSNMEKYFGKRNLAYLRGQEIREKLMANIRVLDSEGNLIKKGI
jgi:hypothetical protein